MAATLMLQDSNSQLIMSLFMIGYFAEHLW